MTTATVERMLLTIDEVAERLNVSKRHVDVLLAAGRLLAPIRLGRRKLWSADELSAYIRAGCPSRDQWEEIKAGAA